MKSTSTASLPPTVPLLEDDLDVAVVAVDTTRQFGLTEAREALAAGSGDGSP